VAFLLESSEDIESAVESDTEAEQAIAGEAIDKLLRHVDSSASDPLRAAGSLGGASLKEPTC